MVIGKVINLSFNGIIDLCHNCVVGRAIWYGRLTMSLPPRWYPHMNELEWIEFMESKGFHFSEEDKEEVRIKQKKEELK
jgi:hypothetical protein